MPVIGVWVLIVLLGSAGLGEAAPEGYATTGAAAASEAVPGVQITRGLCLPAAEATAPCTACARAGCPLGCSGAPEPKPSNDGDAALARAVITAGTGRETVDRATGPRLVADPGLPGDCACVQAHDVEANGARNCGGGDSGILELTAGGDHDCVGPW